MTTFEIWWREQYGALPPLGYVLREACRERWFRIHSLPESKRYAETPGEYQELLARHNAIASDVLGAGGACWLAVVYYEAEPESNRAPDLPGVSAHWARAMRFDAPKNPFIMDDTPRPMLVWTASITWKRRQYDDLIRLIADDQAPQVVLAALDSARIYHPYDGGADLILESSAARDALKSKYAAWLSKHPQGL